MLCFLHLNYHNLPTVSLCFILKYYGRLFSTLIALLFASLLHGQATTASEPIITKHSSWYYYDGGDLANDWHVTGIGKNWKKGQAPFGYNMDSISTALDYGTDSQNKRMVYYFKKPVTLEQPSAQVAYILNIRRDDGIIVYVNGKEVGRQNMPLKSDATENNRNRATRLVNGEAELKYYPMLLNTSVFKSGLNIISASVHQRAAVSSDLVFDLELRRLNSLFQFESEINALHKPENSNLEYELLSSQLAYEKTNTEHQLLLQKIDYKSKAYSIALSLLFVVSLLMAWLTFYYQKRNKALLLKLKDHQLFVEKSNQEKLKNNIQSIEYSSFLESLQTKLTQIQNNRVLQQKDINALIQTIKDRRKNKVNLEEIAIHVDSLNANFSKRLLLAFPSLTQSEIRHCCLMRVQFSTKEISRILHVDPRSVQTARYRIKKKLKLKENENLVRFLLQY